MNLILSYHRFMPVFVVMLFFLCSVALAQEKGLSKAVAPYNVAGAPSHAVFNVNYMSSWSRSDGLNNASPSISANGLRFPRFTATAIYLDGIVWGGKVYLDAGHSVEPDSQLIRAGGSHFKTGTASGRVVGFGAGAVPSNPDAADARMYRIRRDYSTMSDDELRMDAAEVNEIPQNDVTEEHKQAILTQYETDWNEWPVAYGAPFVDRNGNGVYDPPPAFSESFTADSLVLGNYDEPGLAGAFPDQPADQVMWTVYNDLDRTITDSAFASEPMGLEVQKTIWGYNNTDGLGFVYFTRVKIINKGGVDVGGGEKGAFNIDSMYVAQWSDPDVGSSSDDLVGCDTLLSGGYAYNGSAQDEEYQPFSLPPPSVGYYILAGPLVPSAGDTAWREFQAVEDYKNLPMTSFGYFGAGMPYSSPGGDYSHSVIYFYKVMRGYATLDGPDVRYSHPEGVTPGPFPLSGDPTTQSGFIDGLGTIYSFAPGDRRFMINSGPFQLAPGDSQEVVIATVAGLGSDRLSSIAVMRVNAQVAREIFKYLNTGGSFTTSIEDNALPERFALDQNYPNPFNPTTRIQFSLPRATEVSLKIHNLLGQEVAELVHSELQPGTHVYEWDGRSMGGERVASGMYFYRLTADNFVQTRTMILLK